MSELHRDSRKSVIFTHEDYQRMYDKKLSDVLGAIHESLRESGGTPIAFRSEDIVSHYAPGGRAVITAFSNGLADEVELMFDSKSSQGQVLHSQRVTYRLNGQVTSASTYVWDHEKSHQATKMGLSHRRNAENYKLRTIAPQFDEFGCQLIARNMGHLGEIQSLPRGQEPGAILRRLEVIKPSPA